jgi:hypothetical protein
MIIPTNLSGLGDSTLTCHGMSPQRSGATIESSSDWAACWCISTGLCSSANYTASQALVNPDLAYGSIPQPQPPSAVSAGTSTTPAPYTPDQYNAAVDAALANESSANQAQYQQYFSGVQSSLDSLGAGQSQASLSLAFAFLKK